MTEVSLQLRKWLTSLNDADLGVILSISQPLRAGAQMPPVGKKPRSALRRELLAARTWATRAPLQQLTPVAASVLPAAADLLNRHHAFDLKIVDDPDLEQLTWMLRTLGRPIGQLVLFGLLLDDVPASPLAREHRTALEEALGSANRKLVPVPAPSKRHDALMKVHPESESGADAAPADDGGRGGTPAQRHVTADELADLESSLVEVRERSGDLAARLREAAGEVEFGRAPALIVGSLLTEHVELRGRFVCELAEVTEMPPAAGFDEFGQLLGTLRDELEWKQREQETVNRRAEELQQQIRDLQLLIESVPDAARAHLQTARDAMQADLDALVPAQREPEPVPPEPQCSADDEAAAASQDEQPGTDAEPPARTEPEETSELRVDTSVEIVGNAGELAIGFPWEEGTPPVAVALIMAGRVTEAYWVTAMSAEPDRRAAVLRFVAGAYGAYGNADATATLAALDLDAQELSGDADAAVLATSAILRAGFVAGWAHPSLSQLRPELTLPEPWSALVDTAIAAVRRGYRVDSGVGALLPETDPDDARAELGRRAVSLADELPRRKNSYQRATRVLQWLMVTGQPLANALDAVIAWSNGSGDGQALAAALAELSAPEATETMIERADAAMRTPRQAREPIVAVALRALRRSIDEVRTIVHEADVMSRRITTSESDDSAVAMALSRAVANIESVDLPPGMAGAAMSLLYRWLVDPTKVIGSASANCGSSSGVPQVPAEPSTDVLLPLHDLPRRANGGPDPDDPQTSMVLARLVEPPDLAEAVKIYCERGDLRRARRIIELNESGFWPTVTDGAAAAMREVVTGAAETWTRRHHAALAEARDLFARIRTQNLLDQNDETAVSGRLEALATVSEDAFDIASAQLAELTEELDGKQRLRIDELREELETLGIPVVDRERILTLLEDGDTVTATEFLAFVRAGKSLPEHAEQTAHDVKTFAGLLRSGVVEALGSAQVSARAWAALAADGAELTPLGTTGIEAWDSLAEPTRHSGDRLANSVRDVLRTLGLPCSNRPREINPRARQGFRKFRVQAVPSDGSYVAALGSAATDYTVTVVVEEQRGRPLLGVLGQEDAGRANVVLYPHRLDLTARQNLAAEASSSPVQALVVDAAVVGWVAARAPGSWRATQRITLPWTALNPYTPFVAGLVPPEVFVGRAREMSELIDPSGGLFVYGGRQLGKSALLRRVEATFDDGEFHRAVYLDLKGRGIGEAEPASRIWRELTIELKARGILGAKVSDDAPAEVVISQVRSWVTANPGRRVLLLADEADAFLTADSRGVPTSGGVAHFPNVLRLKELMESAERRFKVVFAGLHQVQRFGHLSNVPLAHGGPDILVGPLDPPDARRLVVEPMAALGYSFERPELVWRLLSATNYQASLIQIFCEELVTTLHRRRAHGRALPALVTEGDVDAVAAGDRVRGRIAERLRITINLEDRYRVLTLVIALHSLNDSFGADYAPEELLELARERWPAGFDDLTASQVSIYLDEMVGLGLLIRLSGRNRYAVRSPNVVNMLGTGADLERELAETDFDLPYEYNPREARRLLESAQGRERRSPLTDGQLSELTAVGAMSVVTGTSALGLDRVPAAVRDYAEMRGNKVEVHESPSDVGKAVTAAARRTRPTIIVADMRGKVFEDVKPTAERLAKERPASVLLADPGIAPALAEVVGTQPIRPARWTSGSLRSWPECPFDVPASRARLIEASGGWPDLVEDVIALVVTRGATQAQALERVQLVSSDEARAAVQLEEAGLDADMIGRIGNWVDYFDPGEFVSPADVAAALELGLSAVGELLTELATLGVLDETSEGLALDRVVHRCLRTVRGDS